jgi:hypothetical protein
MIRAEWRTTDDTYHLQWTKDESYSFSSDSQGLILENTPEQFSQSGPVDALQILFSTTIYTATSMRQLYYGYLLQKMDEAYFIENANEVDMEAFP